MDTKTVIDLKPFCDTEDGRFSLSKSFVRSHWEYATDGRICVRLESMEKDSPEEFGTFPRTVATIFEWFPKEGFADIDRLIEEDLPDENYHKRPCECCKVVRCRRCLGSKTCECHACGQDTGCEACDGEGKELAKNPTCTKCDDMGGVFHRRYRIGQTWFAERYINKIKAIAGVEVATCTDGKCVMLAFRFDGGQGLLMSLDY